MAVVSTEDIKRLVEDCGAKFVEKGFQDCTHLVTTLKDGRVRSRKVTPADEQGCHTVSMDWLLGTIKKKAPEKIKEFLLKHKTLRRAFRGALVVANNDRGHTGPKRDREDDSDGDDGVSKKAVVSSAKADMEASMKIKRERNSEGLAKLVEDKFKEKGLIVLQRLVFSCIDILQGKKLTVWLDDSGFIWDVTLVKLDEELSHQLMRMQIIHAAGPNEAWAWRCKYHSSIDSTPAIKSSGHSESRFEDFASARTKFEYLFKTFTGVQWNYRGSKSLPAHWVFVDLNPSADLIDCDIEGVTAEVLAILEMIFSKKYAEAYANALETSGGTYNFTTKEGRRRLRLAVACMQMHMKLGASSIDGNTPSDLDFVFRNLVHPNIPEPRSTAQDQKDQTMFEALDLLLKLQNAHNLMAKADCSATSLSQIYQSLGVAKMDLGASFCDHRFGSYY
ncbi:unnamed protein product [Penicillium olsonii]|uniref:BRCT domain-containing protein n=1 Tax=Penicillium olsonii TaxID=99116 RepID=A0A9W4HCN9_PENOL|nr:unnamed protein product [Penicillium olsonii]CAG7970899.1 unnamed protein product [Penicillium olsonii]